MIRIAKVRTIARWELASVVRRAAFLISTFVMPLFMGAMFAGVALLEVHAVATQSGGPGKWGIVDQARVLALAGDAESFRRFAGEADARRALDARHVGGYFVIVPGYLASGTVRLVTRDDGPSASLRSSYAERALGRMIRRRLIEGRVPADVLARALDPVHVERSVLSSRGAERADDDADLHRMTVPLLIGVILLLSLVSTSSYLVQGLALEKENKLVEVLLSSASSDEILAGKLLGLAGAGLVQIGAWCAMLAALALPSHAFPVGLYVPWHAVIAAVPLFLLGYLFVGSLMLATGSLGSSLRESQQLGMLWILPTMLPLMLMAVLVPDPHGTLAHVLTWFPFSAPITIVTRLSLDQEGTASWEIAGACASLVLSTWVAVKIAARLFRVGLLLTGARPSVRELWRQSRA